MSTIRPVLAIVVGLLLAAGVGAARGGEDGGGLAVWDTGGTSAASLAPAALGAKDGWTQAPAGQTLASFKGDAVVSNGRLWAVLRKQAAAVDIYSTAANGIVSRAQLAVVAAGGEAAGRMERVSLVENGKGGACVEAVCKTEKGAELAVKFRLKRGDIALEAEPGSGAGALRIECPSQFLVLPDFFADDIVIIPRKVPLAKIEAPSENFLLHLTAGGGAIVMCVFENRQQDARVMLAGEGDQRAVTGSEVSFGEPGKAPAPAAPQGDAKAPPGRRIWLAVLQGPRIWHRADLQAADAGKIMSLEWKMPMPAQWRVDFSRPGDLTDSWEMLLQEKEGGEYRKPGWLRSGMDGIPTDRKRWTTVLGSFKYPCWSDPAGQGYFQPLKHEKLSFEGPAVIYPINRVEKTPLDAFTVVDVVRNTLGVGPCEYILDVEGNRSEYKGRATCAVRSKLTDIYSKKQQKEKRAEVDKTLDEGLAFVKHIRGRITRYVEFGHKMLEYLAEQKKAHPELAEPIAGLENLTKEIDARFAARQKVIKTPEHVAAMNEEFRKNLLDDSGPDALKKCKEYAEALVAIGGNQDELAGEGRWAVKALRQRAGMLMALHPKLAPIATEIRVRTQEALRNPAGHEGARH